MSNKISRLARLFGRKNPRYLFTPSFVAGEDMAGDEQSAVRPTGATVIDANGVKRSECQRASGAICWLRSDRLAPINEG